MIKKNMSLSKANTSVLIVATMALLAACSRGGNVPSTWKGNTAVLTNLTKAACKSPKALNVNALNQDRLQKLGKSETSNGTDSPARNAVRTILTKDTGLSDNGSMPPGAIDIAELPIQQTVEQHQRSEKNMVVQVNDINCETLEATYVGPGLKQAIRGQIKGLSHKEIRIEGVDTTTGSNVVVTVSINDMPKRKGGKPEARNSIEKDLAKGFYKMTVAIAETMKSPDGASSSRTIKILQESSLNDDVDVELDLSVLSPMFAELDKKGSASPESQELRQAYNEALANKKETLTVKFSKLVGLKSETSERRATDTALAPLTAEPKIETGNKI